MSLLDLKRKNYFFSLDKKLIFDDEGNQIGNIQYRRFSSTFSIYDSNDVLVSNIKRKRFSKIHYTFEDNISNLIRSVFRKEPVMVNQTGKEILKAWVYSRGWDVRI